MKALRPHTQKPFDVHLMISPVDNFLDAFAEAGADIITVHPEAGPHLHRTIQRVKALGKKAGVSLNPATPAKVLDYVLEEVDLVLVMSVNPGFGGQKFISGQLKKIEAIANRIAEENLDVTLEVDGGIDAETARQAVGAGATALVAGTAAFRGGPVRLCRQHQGAQGQRVSEDGLGRRARGRQQACPRLVPVAAEALEAAAQARRRPARPCPWRARRAATPCSPAASPSAARRLPLKDLDFAAVGATGSLAEQLQGFSWLRDLAAAASREKGARLAEAVVGRWLLAHGTRVDEAWAPHLWGERILFWTAYAPYILSSGDSGYRSALLNTLARGARHLDSTADKAAAGLDRVTAWCGVVAAGLLVQGGVPRVARGEAGLARALASAQFDDGGLISRSPYRAGPTGRPLRASARLLHGGQAGHAGRHRGSGAGIARRASWHHDGRRRAVELAGLRSRRGGASDRADRRLRPSRAAASAGARLGLSADVGARHDPGARRRPAAAAEDGRTGLRLDPRVRTVGRCSTAGGQLRRSRASPDGSFRRAGRRRFARPPRTARLILADTNSTNILADGTLGKGVEDVTIERSEDNDASRLEASHDGYVRAFGLIHKRSLMLGNDGKELRGADQLIAQGPQEDPRRLRRMPSASISRRASKRRSPPTAWARSSARRARRRGTSAAAAATSRSRKACGSTAAAAPTTSIQLVIVGEVSALGGEIGWTFRRAS